MTRAELRTLMLSWLDDSQSGYFDATTCNTWLNLAQRKVQMALLNAGQNYYMKPVITTLVYGQQDYVLPSDFMVEHRLEIVISGTGTNENRRPLSQITTNQQDMISIGLGTPSAYYIKKDRVTISPTPSSALTLRLYYSPRVADMTSDADSPDVPEQFMEYVAIIAAYDGFIKDDRAPENLIRKKDEYEKTLNQMAVDRVQDAPRMVVETLNYNYGPLF